MIFWNYYIQMNINKDIEKFLKFSVNILYGDLRKLEELEE